MTETSGGRGGEGGALHRVFIALGSNLGDRLANLRAALALLEAEGVAVTRASAAWESAAVPADQPPFLNAAAAVETGLGPHELLALLKQVEHVLGRRPGRRWGPRPIDLDILFFDGLEMDTPGLTIPHPEVRNRGFVLAPLAEIEPGPLPVLGRTARELLAPEQAQGLRRTSYRLR